MTLGNAAAAHVRLIVWCLDCRHQVEPDPAEMAERYGAETAVPDWHSRLVCSECGGRRVDMVVTGTERR
jgi:hypothetical protein